MAWLPRVEPRDLLAPALAAGCGLLAVRGFPPHGELWVLLPALAGLLGLIFRAGSAKRGAWLGFSFGVAHFTYGFVWLLTSLHDHGGIPMPLAWLILLLLAAYMALYPALFGALLPALAPRSWLLPLAAPALWVLCEELRSHLFTGFAWNLLGYVLDADPTLMQAADLGGVYFLSWVVMAAAALLVAPWGHPWSLKGVGAALLLMGGMWSGLHLYGTSRLEHLSRPTLLKDPLRVALVQGNIPQTLKWDQSFQEETMRIYHALTRELERPVDLVVWPETAIPFFLQNRPTEIALLKEMVQGLKTALLTGVPTADETEGGEWAYYNSMILLESDAPRLLRYNKHHLVPFGEYVPLRGIMPEQVVKLTYGTKDFTPGPGAVSLPWDRGAVGALICYEAVVAEQVREVALTGAQWLVNVTNDGWFGPTAKPQHLAMARMRAVENRLPMIRAANTGISAAFDHTGRELGRLEADERGVLRLTVPAGEGKSFYRTSGPLFWNSLFLGMLLLAWGLGRRARLARGRGGGMLFGGGGARPLDTD